MATEFFGPGDGKRKGRPGTAFSLDAVQNVFRQAIAAQGSRARKSPRPPPEPFGRRLTEYDGEIHYKGIHHEGPHHLVVLVFDNVAVPDIEARDVEAGLYRSDLTRVGDDRVLEAFLPGHDAHGHGGWDHPGDRGPAQYLKPDQMDVDGMGIHREIVYIPLLGAACNRVFSYIDHDLGAALEGDFLACPRHIAPHEGDTGGR
jgi:hypothetical protein